MAKKKKETKKEEKAKEVKQELTIEEKFAELNDKHLRLFAEFENFKKHSTPLTAKKIKRYTIALEVI